MKIKDRVVLGVIAGLAGNAAKTVLDEISLRAKISQRAFRSTAAKVWVATRQEAQSVNGQVLGGVLDMGMGSLGGIGVVYLLSKTGRDHTAVKGLLSGISLGATINAVLSALPNNKVRPKDAASNLSYMASHAVYGLVTAAVASKLGDASIFDVRPVNDYLPPTNLTTEQRRALSNERDSERGQYEDNLSNQALTGSSSDFQSKT